MTHNDLVNEACAWLRRNHYRVIFRERQSRHETPDAMGWKSTGHSLLIECKVSLSDFRADQKKKPRTSSRIGIGELRYYMAPRGLIPVGELPSGWGLLELWGTKRKSVHRIRESEIHKLGVHQLRNELRMLISELVLYQGIPSGEITPLQSKRIQEIQENLRRLTLDK